VLFIETILYLIKGVNIKIKTINYSVSEYRVQFGVNFAKFGLSVFTENKLLFLKFSINFSIYSKEGQI